MKSFKLILIRVVIGVCILLTALALIPVTVLRITEQERDPSISRQLIQFDAQTGDTFSLVWIHSVTKQPVTEVYRINDDLTIGIVEMFFNEHGPNLPSGPEGGTKWEIKDGMFRVYNYDTIFEALPVRIGQVVADHTFLYKEHRIALRELSRPGGFIHIRAQRINALQYLFEEGKQWKRKEPTTTV